MGGHEETDNTAFSDQPQPLPTPPNQLQPAPTSPSQPQPRRFAKTPDYRNPEPFVKISKKTQEGTRKRITRRFRTSTNPSQPAPTSANQPQPTTTQTICENAELS